MRRILMILIYIRNKKPQKKAREFTKSRRDWLYDMLRQFSGTSFLDVVLKRLQISGNKLL